MKKQDHFWHTIWFRWIAGIGIPLLALGGVWVLYQAGSPFFCVFHKLTGLYCPGCGSGRASVSLIHFDFISALRYNALYVIFLPFIGYYLIKQYIILVFRKDLLPMFSLDGRLGFFLVMVILIFGVLRNIPVYPFTMLAP